MIKMQPYEVLSALLNANLNTVVKLVENEGSVYPHLTKLLKAHGAAKAQRLLQLTKSALAYDTTIPGNPPNIDGGGIAYVKLPRQRLQAQYGGQPATWNGDINLFCVLGLVIRHKPGNHSEAKNTPAENYSIKVAKSKGNGSRAATWYTFPRYTHARLSEADRRAEALRGRPAGKDAVRDALGNEIANRAHDSAYDINPDTLRHRERLRKAALSRLDAYGYFYPEDVLNDVLTASDASEERWIRRAWSEYKTTLATDEGLTDAHRPTNTEQTFYHLTNLKHIVTRRQ